MVVWLREAMDAAERAASRWHDVECDVHTTSLTDAAVLQSATLCDCGGPTAVLRRIAADRKTLARHQPKEVVYGIGPVGRILACSYDPHPWPCPDITDLAEGYGWKEDQ
jgi:hypothetical protein